MMENNEKMVLTEQPIGKEYQIPELIDLNGIGEALTAGYLCESGSSAVFWCNSGGAN